MAERQKHGFIYQGRVVKRLELHLSKFSIVEDKKYTGPYDAVVYRSKYSLPVPLKIKYIKEGSPIDMSDYFRNCYINVDFILIVGRWSESRENIVEQQVLSIPKRIWNPFFIRPAGFNSRLKSLIKNISNSHTDDAKWKKETNKFKSEWEDYWTEYGLEEYSKRPVKIRFKRDHKKQKRIQCAIPNKIFYNKFVDERTHLKNIENILGGQYNKLNL